MFSLCSPQLFVIAETRLVVVGDELLPGLFHFDEPAGNGLIERLRNNNSLHHEELIKGSNGMQLTLCNLMKLVFALKDFHYFHSDHFLTNENYKRL